MSFFKSSLSNKTKQIVFTFKNYNFFMQHFILLKEQNPDFEKKIVGIHGDGTKPGLGMSDPDRELINKKVNLKK